MKNKGLVIGLVVALILIFLAGVGTFGFIIVKSVLDNQNTSEVETEKSEKKKDKEKEKEEEEEEEEKVNKSKYTSYSVDTLTFYVPKDWKYKETNGTKYFYFNDSNDYFLMVYKGDFKTTDVDSNQFKALVDGFAKGFAESESVSNGVINSTKVTGKRSNYYFADLDINGTVSDKNRQFLMTLVFNNKTGAVYVFSITSPTKVSDDDVETFKYIIDNIEFSK